MGRRRFHARAAAVALTTLLLAGTATVPAHAVANVACSTADLVQAITDSNNGVGDSTLSLASYCVYTLTDSDGALPTVTAPLVIQGNHATIRRDPAAANNFRIFRVGDVSLTMDTLSVMNGLAVDNGGAVYLGASGGSLTATDVNFQGNSADFGGAIATEDGTAVTLTGGTVHDNRAISSGGGIYAIGATPVSLDSVTVSGNRSNSYAAGLYLSTNAAVNITDSTISHNTARFAGGGIYYTGTVSMAITGSTIADNRVTNSLESGAGILYNASSGSSIGTISDSTISGNTVTGFTTDDTASNGGGGITLETGPLILDNTKVTGNQVIGASAHGGGIAVNAIYASPPPALALQNGTTVTGNLASGRYAKGGGVYANAAVASLTVTVSLAHIDGNKVTGTGSSAGGVFNTGGTFSFGGASVNDNTAPNAPAPGGVSTDTAITSVSGTTFTGNTPTNCLLSPAAVTNCVN